MSVELIGGSLAARPDPAGSLGGRAKASQEVALRSETKQTASKSNQELAMGRGHGATIIKSQEPGGTGELSRSAPSAP